MKLPQTPFTVPDWDKIPRTEHPGERGTSFWRTVESNGLRVRMVDYAPGYTSDHWCPRGHVFLVLEGEVIIRLKDGREQRLTAGQSFQASDDEANPHQVDSPLGARVFNVD
jgi:quercetin dioxygenase-like cupin family protein